jgi:hypothetical protein
VSVAIPRLRPTLAALSIGWWLFLLVPLSSTGLDFPSFSFVLALTVLLGALALALALTRQPPSRVRLVAWCAYPLAATLLVALFLASQTPANPLFRLRFSLSRPALEEAARMALAQRPPATPAWIGLFPVRRIDVLAPEVRFISDGCGVVDECGLLYRAERLPAGRTKTRIKALGGGWYHLYSVF